MFEHVTMLASFVYAIALTHLLSSTNELLIAHKRVRFSGLYALWVLNVLILLLVNWLSLRGLVVLKQWTVMEAVIVFVAAIGQYYICSTFRITEPHGEPIDLPELYEERRPIIFGAMLAFAAVSVFQNWWDRNNMAGIGPNDWIGEDLSVAAMTVTVIIGGWARNHQLQWAAALTQLSIGVAFLLAYAIPGA